MSAQIKKMINDFKNDKLNQIKEVIKQNWNVVIGKEIATKVDLKTKEYIDFYARNFPYQPPSSTADYETEPNLFLISERPVDLIGPLNLIPRKPFLINDIENNTSRTISINPRYENAFRLQVEQETKVIKADYETEFSQLYPTINARLNAQIDHYDLDHVVENFLKVHEWVRSELNNYYLQKEICNHLMNSLIGMITELSPYDLEKIRRGDVMFKPIEPLTISNQVTSCLPQVLKALLQNANPYFPSLVMDLQKREAANVDFNYVAKRMDLYRLLVKNYPQQMTSITTRDGIACTQILPVDLTEFNHLSVQELNYLQTLLLNIGTEESPQWMLLHKKADRQWAVYIPEGFDATGVKNLKATIEGKLASQCHMVEVNYTVNSQLNDITAKTISPTNQWHAVLLGRVLPWIYDNKQQSNLESYRHKVPLPFLMELTFKEFLHRPDGEFISYEAFEKKIRDHFFTFEPLKAIVYTKFFLTNTLGFFDRSELIIDEKNQACSVSINPSNEQLFSALTIAFRYPSFHHLSFPCNYTSESLSKQIQWLFDNDINLLTISPFDKSVTPAKPSPLFNHGMQCAARNRFLSALPDYASLIQSIKKAGRDSIEPRKNLWKTAGDAMLALLREPSDDLTSHAFCQKMVQFKRQWYKDCCPDGARGELTPKEWAFLQIAQMGTQGLDVIFDSLSQLDEAPSLSCTFDLSGSLYGRSEHKTACTEYIKHLTRKILDFKGKAPLFKQLSLILPDNLSVEECNALHSLVYAIDDRLTDASKASKKNKGTLIFHNATIEGNFASVFLDKLNQAIHLSSLASSNSEVGPLQLQVSIPEWDKTAYQEPDRQKTKGKYHQIQNAIEDNCRYLNIDDLLRNQKPLKQCKNGKLEPSVLLKNNPAEQKQQWREKSYSLGHANFGIQQQQQQQQQQVVQQQQQQQFQEEEEEEEQEHPIESFNGDIAALWDRNNYDARLFSMWVGSDKNAPEVIEKIEPAALEKLLEHESQFKFGINKDNLPPGFYLARPKDDASRYLILGFSQLREQADISRRAAMAPKKRNVFKVVLEKPKEPILTPMNVGDYRQINKLSSDSIHQQTLWKYLTSPAEIDPEQLRNAQAFIGRLGYQNISDVDALIAMQRVDADAKSGVAGKVIFPADFSVCIAAIQAWASNQLVSSHSRSSADLISSLFDKKNPSYFTEANAKAFGQLFHYYDSNRVDDTEPTGTEQWLLLAQEIMQAFGPKNFATWKARCLDPSLNWTECLAKAEVDAVTDSIATLSKAPDKYKKCWWALVEAHGKSVGHMSYAHLWAPYQKLLAYLNHKNLSMNADEFQGYLKANPGINAQVFLDRVFFVLKKAEKQSGAKEVQQAMLDSLGDMDWRHNGCYYASRYDNYPFWDKRLKLTNLSTCTNSAEDGYLPLWNAASSVNKPVRQTLRFISQRLQLNREHFDDVRIQLTSFKDDKAFALPLHLLCACLSIGVDEVDGLSDIQKTIQALKDASSQSQFVLTRLCNLLPLGTDPFVRHSLHLRFQDAPLMLEQLSQYPAFLRRLDDESFLRFINTCGRAWQCYESMSKNDLNFDGNAAFTAFLKHLTNESLDKNTKDLLAFCPWLIDDNLNDVSSGIMRNIQQSDQCDLLRTQLLSIDFSTSTFLPTQSDLSKVFTTLAAAKKNPASVRHAIVKEWSDKGLVTVEQDTQFRFVSDLEKNQALLSVEHVLNKSYQEENKALCGILLNHLAVDGNSENSPEEQLNQLIQVMVSIDNKPFYNELGQVLGLLIQHAGAGKRYSMPQLTTWLGMFVDKHDPCGTYYPVNLLDEVLTNATSSTLLNTRLSKLEAEAPSDQEQFIKRMLNLHLPNQSQKQLVQLVFNNHLNQANDYLTLLRRLGYFNPEWLTALNGLVNHWVANGKSIDQSMLSDLSYTLADLRDSGASDQTLNTLWRRTQIKLIEQRTKGLPDEFKFQFESSPSLKIILLNSIRDVSLADGEKAQRLLSMWPAKELSALALYCASQPNLVLTETTCKMKNAEALIHHFETQQQATDENGNSKRLYSTSELDQTNLLRILKGFKRKGERYLESKEQKSLLDLLYYTNAYSQLEKLSALPFAELSQRLKTVLAEDKNGPYYSARLLACMREIVLRKTGKWANHTQMLDLLYASLHNDEGLLHQVRTGEGKSIITIMRASYLALTGSVVDVFSAKDSLSERDHEEFAPVLDAMGIPHAYINANSEASAYKGNVSNKIGCINYATIGNFSLYHSAHIWNQKSKTDFDKAKRVAILDEADHVLLEETTQFNYSAGSEHDGAHNLDAWVYRVAYQYYAENAEALNPNQQDDANPLSISSENLKALCKKLCNQASDSPNGSRFLMDYVYPALDGTEANLDKRDQALVKLLTAARGAHDLIEGKDYCVVAEEQSIGGLTIPTRCAKVMINSQICEGSRYSELVHQFLHTKLNLEAAKRGQQPNYFIDPYSQVAISQNAAYLLEKLYYKIEGCTGTAGDEAALDAYRAFNIHQVIKLETHQPIKTEFKSTLYCDGDKAQIDRIVEQIKSNGNGPILVTCEDDIAVKRIAAAITEKLGKRTQKIVITDTNDSGKLEREIVPLAGKLNTITVSSRLGRGTDIKPAGESGLYVLRTYPSNSRVVKQEEGRQGRNAAPGRTQDVLDYKAIKEKYDFYNGNVYGDDLKQLIKKEQKRLAIKQSKTVSKRAWPEKANDKSNDEKYVITRAVQQLEEQIKHEAERYRIQKDNLMNAFSGKLLDVLSQYPSSNGSQFLREHWPECRKQIEAMWDARFIDQGDDINEEQALDDFKQKALSAWTGFYAPIYEPAIREQLAGLLQKSRVKYKTAVSTKEGRSPIRQEVQDMPELMAFYQKWLMGAKQHHFDNKELTEKTLKQFYGKDNQYLDQFFTELRSINTDVDTEKSQQIFGRLSNIVAASSAPYCLSTKYWKTIIKDCFIKAKEGDDALKQHLNNLEHFFNQPWLTQQPIEMLKKEDSLAIERLLKQSLTIADTTQGIDAKAKTVIHRLGEVIKTSFWKQFDDSLAMSLGELFSINQATVELLDANTNSMKALIEVVADNSSSHQSLKKYLKDHAQGLLDTSPAALLAVFKLALVDDEHRLKNYLPKPPVLKEATSADTETRCWEFFTQRMPIVEGEYNALIAALKNMGQPINQLNLNSLLTLPPYLSVGYIAHHLPKNTEFATYEKTIEDIRLAGKAFNQFTSSRRWISSVDQFKWVIDNEAHQTWQTLFNELDPKRNAVFFNEAKKYPTLSLEMLQTLFKGFSENDTYGVTPEQLNNVFSLAATVDEPVDYLSDLVKQQFSGCFEKNNMQKLQSFWKVVSSHSDVWEKNKSALLCLWRNYQAEKIPNASDLKKATHIVLSSIKDRDNGKISEVFSAIDKEAPKRKTLMQYLEHGLLDLGIAFTKTCFKAYQALADKLTVLPADFYEKNPPGVRHRLLVKGYQKIRQFTDEMGDIAQPPFSTIPLNNSMAKPSVDALITENMHSLFSKNKTQYDSYWWKNAERKDQSDELFRNLYKITQDDKGSYYQAVLETIWTSQQRIINSDKKTKRNTKGYSRLYDVSLHMFITVASDCLRDKDVSIEQRGKLQGLLATQLSFHLDALSERLSHAKYNGLKQRVDDAKADPEKLETMIIELKKMGAVPKELVYLVDNVECFLKLSKDASSQQGDSYGARH